MLTQDMKVLQSNLQFKDELVRSLLNAQGAWQECLLRAQTEQRRIRDEYDELKTRFHEFQAACCEAMAKSLP